MSENIKDFIAACKSDIYNLSLEKAIAQAENLGVLLRANQLGVYSLNEIETYLINQAVLMLNDFSDYERPHVTEQISEKYKILFIATELYHVGGHTRLMERLATFLDERPDLLLSKINSSSIKSRVDGFFAAIDECDNACELDKIRFILRKILRYDVVILNTHPEDISAIIACGVAKQINKKINIHFVNHADHTFSYGSTVADVWYEISDYGRCVDVQRNLTAQKCFLGIPIDNASFDSKSNYSFKNGDLILTAAARGKYKPKHGVSIMPLVYSLLDKYPKSSLQVIGADFFRDYWWWVPKIKYGNRLIISKSLPYQEYLKTTSAASLYIDSHPFPGGTAFVEQFLNGRLCTGLVCEYKGYTPAELFKRYDCDGVLCFIETISIAELNRVRDLILDVHGCESVKLRFCDAIFKNMYYINSIDSCEKGVTLNVNNYIDAISPRFKCNGFKQFKLLFLISRKLSFFMYIVKFLNLKISFLLKG